jgi:hypothetical protein
VWRREIVAEGKKSHIWCRPYRSVRTLFLYMYAGFSGDRHVRLGVLRRDFLGNSRSIQADINSRTLTSVGHTGAARADL